MATAPKAASPRATAAPRGLVSEAVDIVRTVFFALLIAVVLRTIVFQPYTIPSESMEPGLLTGDYIIVSKWSYGWSHHSILFSPHIFSGRIFGREPERGDVIVFAEPRDPDHTDYIKRLIGLPGDHIQVRHGQVFINNVAVPRTPLGLTEDPGAPGLQVQQVRETLPGGRTYVTYDRGEGPADNTAVYVVPPHCYFMMGDNRDNSLDSRFNPQMDPSADRGCHWTLPADADLGDQAGVGFVPAENLEGRAQLILLSWDHASLFEPWTWFTRLRTDRFFRAIH